MQRGKARWLLAGVILVLLTGAGIYAYYASPVWNRDSLFNYETIRLTPIRVFESLGTKCETCLPERTVGTWRNTSDGIALQAFGSSKSRRMMKVRAGTCGALMDADDFKALHGYNPLAAYTLVGDSSCPEGAPVHPLD
jgi:hypothetical protein